MVKHCCLFCAPITKGSGSSLRKMTRLSTTTDMLISEVNMQTQSSEVFRQDTVAASIVVCMSVRPLVVNSSSGCQSFVETSFRRPHVNLSDRRQFFG